MSKLFKCIFGCCGARQQEERVTPAPNMKAITEQVLPIFGLASGAVNFPLAAMIYPTKRFAKINSMYTTTDIKTSEFRTANFQDLQYSCPICYCYFDKILEVACCKNYICHGCATALNHRVLKNENTDIVTCPFCSTAECVLQDVDPAARVRRYTDTPNPSATPTGSQVIGAVNVEIKPKTNVGHEIPRNESGNKIKGESQEIKDSGVVVVKQELSQNEVTPETGSKLQPFNESQMSLLNRDTPVEVRPMGSPKQELINAV